MNYRRFFAIDTLIGLRIENPKVFEETHRLMGGLLRENLATGLRRRLNVAPARNDEPTLPAGANDVIGDHATDDVRIDATGIES